MNILVQFEDSFGCYELFKESPSILNQESNLYKVTVRNKLSNGQVLKIPVSLRSKNDIILVVFDLDAANNKDYSLTSNYFLKSLERNKLDFNSQEGKDLIDKVIFVPVYFCYETLYLYSYKFRDILNNLDDYNNRSGRILNTIKNSLGYSSLCPESMFNIANKLDYLRLQVRSITNKGSDKWAPQHVYLKLSIELLKLLYVDIAKNQKTDDIFDKSENKLFEEIRRVYGDRELKNLIESIIQGLHEISVRNRVFYEIITLKNIEDLYNLKNKQDKINSMCDELYNYNLSIKGIKRDICDMADDLAIEAYKIHEQVKKNRN